MRGLEMIPLYDQWSRQLSELASYLHKLSRRTKEHKDSLADSYPREAFRQFCDYYQSIAERFDEHLNYDGDVFYHIIRRSERRTNLATRVGEEALAAAKQFEKYARGDEEYSRADVRRLLNNILIPIRSLHDSCIRALETPEEPVPAPSPLEKEPGGKKVRKKKKEVTISVLFLAADPTDASRLRLGEEAREIQEKLQLAKLRDRFEVHQRLSVRPEDLSQALLDIGPTIVHFSGHGTVSGALCFESKLGETHPVKPEALAALFEQFANQVDCVVLNACYSVSQANAIANHIDYVIGMSQGIGDKAAIAFTVGLYQALGAGRSFEEAYELGCVQIRLQGIPEHLTPVLIRKGQQVST